MLNVNELIGFGASNNESPAIKSYAATSNATNTTTLVINTPAEVQPGDLLVAAVVLGAGAAATFTISGGWTELSDANQRAVYVKIATGSEPSSYTITSTVSGNLTGAIVCVTAAAYDVSSVLSTSAVSPVTNSITLARNDSLALIIQTQSSGTSTGTWSLGWSTAVPKTGRVDGGNITAYIQIYYKVFDAGATGTVTVTSSGTSTRAQIIGLKPTY